LDRDDFSVIIFRFGQTLVLVIENNKLREIKRMESHLNKEQLGTLSPRLNEAFIRFLQYHPPARLSKNMRGLLLEFLMNETPADSRYLSKTLFDLEALFELLDVAQEEWKESYD
jgi:hypothetical protein